MKQFIRSGSKIYQSKDELQKEGKNVYNSGNESMKKGYA